MNLDPIPIESNKDWWWYRAKEKLLTYIFDYKLNLKSSCSILEVGPGKGNNIKALSKYGKVDILESEDQFINYLKVNFKNNIGNYYKKLPDIDKKYDVIVLLDVIEHIEDSKKFIKELINNVNDDGFLVIGVPAYMSLWSNHDVKLKHFRRYDWQTLYEDCDGLNLIYRTGFNFILLPLRYLQLKFSKNIHSTGDESRFLNNVLLTISNFENIFRKYIYNPKFGLSLYAVLKK